MSAPTTLLNGTVVYPLVEARMSVVRMPVTNPDSGQMAVCHIHLSDAAFDLGQGWVRDKITANIGCAFLSYHEGKGVMEWQFPVTEGGVISLDFMAIVRKIEAYWQQRGYVVGVESPAEGDNALPG